MYFVLGKSAKPRRWIDDEPFLEGISFWMGVKITQSISEPLEYTLKKLRADAEDHAPYMPSALGVEIPLFRDDLIASLRDCGVDNFDTYGARVLDPGNGAVYENYKAVNILGLVAAADLQKSQFTANGAPMVDVQFDRLEIDPTKARNLLMFRLAEATGTVLVHEHVKNHLTRAGYDDLSFDLPSEVAV